MRNAQCGVRKPLRSLIPHSELRIRWVSLRRPLQEVMNFDFQCGSCGSQQGNLVLDLGIQPLANNLLREQDLSKPEPKFPLRLAVCHSCWLLQIVDLVPAVDLFSEYLYFSSFSDLMLRHAREAATRYIKEFSLGKNSLVVEIASNDGYFLKNFKEAAV